MWRMADLVRDTLLGKGKEVQERLVEMCRRTHEETRRSAARAVDRSLVVRNWLFGWHIVEYEQSGADRAQYGARLLYRMSDRLRQAGIRGTSTKRLKLYRQFYLQRASIGSTLSDQSLLPASTGQIAQTPSAESLSSRRFDRRCPSNLHRGWWHEREAAVRRGGGDEAAGELGTTYGGLAGKSRAEFGSGNARYISFLDVLDEVTVRPRRFDKVPVASSESQNCVALGDVSDMDSEITELEQRLDKTRAIKPGMIQQLLTGSIRLPIPAMSGQGEPNP